MMAEYWHGFDSVGEFVEMRKAWAAAKRKLARETEGRKHDRRIHRRARLLPLGVELWDGDGDCVCGAKATLRLATGGLRCDRHKTAAAPL